MLSRWNPFEEISRLQDEMFRTFGGGERGLMRPSVDIFEDEKSIRLMAELPGIQAEDVKIEIEDNVLTISGERKLEHEENREGYHRVERRFGSFTRSFVLPRTVDSNNIEANMKHGVLTITLTKRAEAQPRKIEVRAGEGDEGQVQPEVRA